MSRRVRVMTIDLQGAFLNPSLSLPEVDTRFARLEKALCIGGVRRVLGTARARGWKVVHVVTEHQGPDDVPYYLRRLLGESPLLTPGEDHTSLVPGVAIEGEETAAKTDFSALRGSGREELIEGCDELILVGVAADCCVQQTAFDAARMGVHVVVPYRAVAASTKGGYIGGLSSIAKSAGSIVDFSELDLDRDFFEQRVKNDRLEPVLDSWVDRSHAVLRDKRERWKRLAAEQFTDVLEEITEQIN